MNKKTIFISIIVLTLFLLNTNSIIWADMFKDIGDVIDTTVETVETVADETLTGAEKKIQNAAKGVQDVINKAKEVLQNAQKAFDDAKKELDKAKQDLQEGIITQEEYDRIKEKFEQAKKNLSSAQGEYNEASNGGGSGITSGGPLEIKNPLTSNTFTELLDKILNFIWNLALIIAPIIIIIGGIIFMTAAGNPEKIKQGKNLILYCLIGLAIIMLARGAIQFFQQIIGVELKQ